MPATLHATNAKQKIIKPSKL